MKALPIVLIALAVALAGCGASVSSKPISATSSPTAGEVALRHEAASWDRLYDRAMDRARRALTAGVPAGRWLDEAAFALGEEEAVGVALGRIEAHNERTP